MGSCGRKEEVRWLLLDGGAEWGDPGDKRLGKAPDAALYRGAESALRSEVPHRGLGESQRFSELGNQKNLGTRVSSDTSWRCDFSSGLASEPLFSPLRNGDRNTYSLGCCEGQ